MKKRKIPFHDFGGSGSIIHFAHANAYPPGCYRQFINSFLPHFKVIGLKQRPLWEGSDFNKLKSWQELATDLIHFFDEHGLRNIVGMGHSLGGVVSVLAAIKRPELFSKLVLIDPVIFKGCLALLISFLPISLRKKVFPPPKISARRRDLWEDKQSVFSYFREKSVFKRFSDTALWDFVDAGTKSTGNGKVTLAFPKEWETQIYATVPIIFGQLKNLSLPILAIKGVQSNVITPEIWQEWKEAQDSNTFLEVPDSGHLVPMEQPEVLAKLILKELSNF